VLSLWSLASSPLIIGSDLNGLCSTDLSMLGNRAVLALDQDAVVAAPVSQRGDEQIVAKTVGPGEAVVGLFDTGDRGRSVSTSAAALGIESCGAGYALENLWTGRQRVVSDETIAAQVPAQGVALLRVTSPCGS
jgi:hypothetical protein